MPIKDGLLQKKAPSFLSWKAAALRKNILQVVTSTTNVASEKKSAQKMVKEILLRTGREREIRHFKSPREQSQSIQG